MAKLKPILSIKPKKIWSKTSAIKFFKDRKNNHWRKHLFELSDDLLQDKEIVLMALEFDMYAYEQLPENMKKDKEIAMAALVLMKISNFTGLTLDVSLFEEEEIVETAIKLRGFDITNFPLALKNKELILFAMENPLEQYRFCYDIYKWIDDRLHDDLDIIKKAAVVNMSVLKHLDRQADKGRPGGELLDSKEFVLGLLGNDHYAFKNQHRYCSHISLISDHLKKDKEIAIAAVNRYAEDIIWFDKSIKKDIDVIEIACLQSDKFIEKFVLNDRSEYAFARKNIRIIKILCTIDVKHIKYATRRDRQNKRFVREVAEYCAEHGTNWHGSNRVKELFEDIWREACRTLQEE